MIFPEIVCEYKLLVMKINEQQPNCFRKFILYFYIKKLATLSTIKLDSIKVELDYHPNYKIQFPS
jgi:hypothetical protein